MDAQVRRFPIALCASEVFENLIEYLGIDDQGEDAYIGTTIGPEERIDIVARLRIGSQDVHCT